MAGPDRTSGPLSLAFLATETQETAGSAGSCCPLSRARPSPPDAETTTSAFYPRFMNVFQSIYPITYIESSTTKSLAQNIFLNDSKIISDFQKVAETGQFCLPASPDDTRCEHRTRSAVTDVRALGLPGGPSLPGPLARGSPSICCPGRGPSGERCSSLCSPSRMSGVSACAH